MPSLPSLDNGLSGRPLHSLLEKRERLRSLTFDSDIVDKVAEFEAIVASEQLINLTKVTNAHSQVSAGLSSIQSSYQEYMAQLDKAIGQKRKELLTSVDRRFNHHIKEEGAIKRASQWTTGQELVEKLQAILGQEATWKFPVAYFEPNTAELSRLLVHGDPFYVFDNWESSIEHVLQRFPDNLSNRIHWYSWDAAKESIPSSSIGLIVTWNNFKFKTLNAIKQDIFDLSEKMMPGGLLLFDFNNGDTPEGAKLSEKNMQCFHWPTRLLEFCAENNLELVYQSDEPAYFTSYMLVRKQGTRPDLPIVSKLGLVTKNPEHLKVQRTNEEYTRTLLKRIKQKVDEEEASRIERDQQLNDLQKTHQVDHQSLLAAKLDRAMNNLDHTIKQHGKNSEAAVLGLINVGTIVLALGRTKDAKQMCEQARRIANNLSSIEVKTKVDEFKKQLN